MFRFEYSDNLWYLLGLIPLLGLLYLGWHWYQKQAKNLGEPLLVEDITRGVSRKRKEWQYILALLIFTLLVVAWANPQWGAKREKVKSKSSDIFIALDISNSMYCQDVAPSRLDQAKRFAAQLVQQLRGERIGLILFAGNAYLQMPLTSDYAAAEVFIQSANPNLAGTQGTAIGDAIRKAEDGFTQDAKYHRVMVIISDGEDHDPDALQMAKEAHEKGMIIFTVGVGTAEGSFIPMNVRGNEDWKRDEEGQPVRTKLNETLLNEVANQGGGDYFYLNNSSSILKDIDQKVDVLEKREFEERSFTEYESYFQLFLGLGILGILWQWIFSNNLIEKKKIPGV
ncbi:MAG: VWA domain-containing protein [Saprospiraceae bacterium]|nr:VWA domain-containing protein [Saprospiraceae bacterium]